MLKLTFLRKQKSLNLKLLSNWFKPTILILNHGNSSPGTEILEDVWGSQMHVQT